MKITVIGKGYVGLVSGTCMAEVGKKQYKLDRRLTSLKTLDTVKFII